MRQPESVYPANWPHVNYGHGSRLHVCTADVSCVDICGMMAVEHQEEHPFDAMDDVQNCYAEIGRRIRRAREDRALTQEALASLIGMTRTSVVNMEKGRQKFLVHTLLGLAAALQVPPATLLPDGEITTAPELDELLAGRSVQEQEWIRTAVGSLREEV